MNGNLYMPISFSPFANGTLAVISGATNSLVAAVPVGIEPFWAVVDPMSGNVYVSNFAPGCIGCGQNYVPPIPSVTVVSGTTNLRVADIPVGAMPEGMAFDPRNGDVYVANSAQDQSNGSVSVISTENDTVVTTVQVEMQPVDVFYDPADGDLYVLDENIQDGYHLADHLTILSGVNNTVIGSVSLDGDTTGSVVSDSSNGDLYVGGADGVTVLSASTDRVITTVTTPGGVPSFVDPRGDVYVLQPGSPANVTVISGATNMVASTFPIGDATEMTYDPGTGDIFASGWDNNQAVLRVISVATHQVVQTLNLGEGYIYVAPTYDPGNGDLYTEVWGTNPNIAIVEGNASTSTGSSSVFSSSWFVFGVGLVTGVLLTSVVGLLVRRRRRRTPTGGRFWL
jgi:YVTN family beta-propeller protein